MQLRKELFGKADREKGRLRAFQLSTLQDYLVDQHKHATAKKRGGGMEFLPLDTTGDEARYREDPVDADTPEKILERKWAVIVLQRTMASLRDAWERGGKSELFATLSPCFFTPVRCRRHPVAHAAVCLKRKANFCHFATTL